MSIILTNRLKTASLLVRKNRKTVDVGTDHGYLPAFLVMTGQIKEAVAADIGKGPLENAKKTISRYSLSESISTVLSDGLENVPDDCEEIIIAGMGGTLIAEILGKAAWIKNEEIHLILQPMTHSYDVRKFLCENGFYIDTEKFCTDDGRYYVVISAFYNGKDNSRDDFYYYFGDVASTESENECRYIKKQTGYLSNRFKGLSGSGNEQESVFYKKLLDKASEKGWLDL